MHMLVQISFLYLLLLYVIAKVQISYRVIRNQNLKCYAHCLCPVKYKNYSHFPCSISILFKIVWIITCFAFLVRKGDGFYLFLSVKLTFQEAHVSFIFVQLKIKNDFDPVLSPESSLFVLKSNKKVRIFVGLLFSLLFPLKHIFTCITRIILARSVIKENEMILS